MICLVFKVIAREFLGCVSNGETSSRYNACMSHSFSSCKHGLLCTHGIYIEASMAIPLCADAKWGCFISPSGRMQPERMGKKVERMSTDVMAAHCQVEYVNCQHSISTETLSVLHLKK